METCRKGHAWTPENTITRSNGHRECRACSRERIRVWRRVNPDKARKHRQTWKQANPDKVREYSQMWRRTHIDKARAYTRAWGHAHPDKGRARGLVWYQRHRAMILAAEPACAYYGLRVGCLGAAKAEIDHKLPRARGGGNERSNLQRLCRPCNQWKSNKTDEEARLLLAGV